MPVKDPPLVSINLPCIPSSSTIPPHATTFKKRKNMEPSTSPTHAIDLDDFEFDEVILKNIMVLNTLVIYFDERIFG